MSTLHVLLPARTGFAAAADWRRWLARADRLPDNPAAREVAVRGLLRFAGDAVPLAALRHHCHADDAATGTWLCADPAWVRSEATGARLMTWPLADLSAAEAAELAATLRPLFGDAGMPLTVDTPSAWCVRLADGAPAVPFTEPSRALGVAMLECLPTGEAGRPWRRLFTEAQVALHAHPVNATRVAAGKQPVNALWFWGAGPLPGGVSTGLAAVASHAEVLRGLARIAHIKTLDPAPEAVHAATAGDEVLLDLGDAAAPVVVQQWWPALRRWLHVGRFTSLALTFASGERFRVRRAHRLRFWRRA
ncbi:MAG: phosphoglycerate mutase [Rhodanobacteraceae bacterium]|nr:MAG: phosphoglycerate mutase [Rhodanobacteraceae bacterium]